MRKGAVIYCFVVGFSNQMTPQPPFSSVVEIIGPLVSAFLNKDVIVPVYVVDDAGHGPVGLAEVEIPEPVNLWNQPGPKWGSVASRGVDDSLVSKEAAKPPSSVANQE
jgi:hypothetical protein